MSGNFLIDSVDFMRQNLVIPNHEQIGQTQDSSGIHTLCFFKAATPGKQHGKDIDRWFLAKHDSKMNPDRVGAIFEAYWCPYAKDDTLTCMLGNGSRYMFTATMDGCSFGVGSQSGDGTCRVAHANESTFAANKEATFGLDGARQFARAEQKNRLVNKLGGDIGVIDPLNYMADHDGAMELKSTTFGYRNGQGWEFYTQKYWKNGTTYFLRDVVRQ